MCEAAAAKPSYDAGVSASVGTAAETESTSNVKAVSGPSAATASVWKVSGDDFDDDDLMDDDDLLDTDELSAAGTAPAVPEGCATKKRACANCSCGRAEIEAANEAAEAAGEPAALTGVLPSSSACGNCYLGDAFRCSSCPYLGMPAFKP